MLQDPLGVVVLVLSLVYWSVAIFKPRKPKAPQQPSPASGEEPSQLGALVASIGFLIAFTLATAAGTYEVLRGFESSPGRSALLLAAIAFLGWLLLARPEKFAYLLVGSIFVFGGIGLLGKCSTNEAESVEMREPRSL